MSLLNVFKNAFATSNQGDGPQQIAKAVGGIAAAMEAYSSDHSRALLTHIIVPWAIQVVQLAPSKWVLPASVPPSCAFLHDNGAACGSFAVGGCHVCGRPICLSHSLIAGDATIVCWTCMRLAAKHATKWTPPGSGASTSELGWAYELLGLESGCTLTEAKRAYRKRIAQFHPDAQPGGKSQAHEQLVKLCTKAYEAIVAARASDKAAT